MTNPVRPEDSPVSGPPSAKGVSPYTISREYEDHLDWLENQRNSRNKRSRRRAWFGVFSGVAALALSLIGVLMRKKSE